MPVYVAVGKPGDTHDQLDDLIRLTPDVRVYWFDRDSRLWLAVFPDGGPDPGPAFCSLNADDRLRLGAGSAALVARMEKSLRAAAT